MENVDLFEIIAQVGPFIGSQNSKGQTEQGPYMDDVVMPFVVFAEFVNLGMAVVAAGNTVGCTGCLDLVVF
jgi:hypothetical protein